MRKSILVIILILIFNSSFAQESQKNSYSARISNFVAWVKDLDNLITSINDTEKLRQLYRLLGDINLDIDNIATEKKILAVKVNRTTVFTQTKSIEELSKQIEHIRSDITILLENLQNLKGLIYQTHEQLSLNNIIDSFQYRKEILLVDIESEIRSGNVDKQKIIDEANGAVKIAEAANTSIVNARAKIVLELEK